MKRKPSQGSTLLEVIVAFAILTLSFSVLLPAMTSMTGSRERAETRWAATEFARSRLSEVGIVDPVRPGVIQGTYVPRWIWRIRTVPYRPPEVAVGADLFTVTITVDDRDSRVLLTKLETILPGKGNGP